MQLAEQRVKFKIVASLAQTLIKPPGAVQYPAFQLRHLGDVELLRFVETTEITHDKAQSIAQTPINVSMLFEDFRADAKIFGIVRTQHPKPENIGTLLVIDILRGDDVAQ